MGLRLQARLKVKCQKKKNKIKFVNIIFYSNKQLDIKSTVIQAMLPKGN